MIKSYKERKEAEKSRVKRTQKIANEEVQEKVTLSTKEQRDKTIRNHVLASMGIGLVP